MYVTKTMIFLKGIKMNCCKISYSELRKTITREKTYTDTSSGKMCGNCIFFTSKLMTYPQGECHAALNREIGSYFICNSFGTCDLWERN